MSRRKSLKTKWYWLVDSEPMKAIAEIVAALSGKFCDEWQHFDPGPMPFLGDRRVPSPPAAPWRTGGSRKRIPSIRLALLVYNSIQSREMQAASHISRISLYTPREMHSRPPCARA